MSVLDCPNGNPRSVDVVLPNDFRITVGRGRRWLVTVIKLNADLQAPCRVIQWEP